jgi:hypothetical protein
MRIIVSLICLVVFVFTSCESNPNYESNLKKAKKTFELFQAEDLETQMSFFSEELVYTPPTYGAKDLSKEEFKSLLQMYHAAFDEIVYTPEVWLPGTDDNGKLDGSVRTYGTWNSKDATTGEQTLPLRSYHFFNFNEKGEVIAQGDFFDATGLMNYINVKNTLTVENENSAELTFIIELDTKGNSKKKVEEFTLYLSDFIAEREPSIVYGYYLSKDGKKVTLVERYKNSQDGIQHGIDFINGPNFTKFFDLFEIESFIAIGKASEEFKKFAKENGFDIEYRESIGGFVRR